MADLFRKRRLLIRRSLSEESVALIAAMTTKPTAARQALIDRTIRSLVSSGVWDRGLIIGYHASHAEQAGLIDWKLPSRVATNVSGTLFTVDRGFTGDAAADHLNWGVEAAALTGYGQDDASSAVWSLTDNSTNGRDFGTVSSGNNHITGRVSGNFRTRANDGTDGATAVADSLGLYGWSRDNSATYVQFKGAVDVATITQASTGIAGGNLTTLRGASSFSDRQIALTFVGKSLSAIQRAALHSISLVYLQGVGAA